MAATLVQSASNVTGGAATVAIGTTQGWATPTAGNLLVAWSDSDTTQTVNQSMTNGPSVVDGNAAYLWWKIATGAETSFTFTAGGSTSPGTFGALEYSGVAAAPTDVQSTSTASGGGTSTTSVSVVATGTSGDLFIAVAGCHRSGAALGAPAPTWTNSFVNRQTVQTTGSAVNVECTAFVADFQNTGAATVSTAASWTGSLIDRQELLIALKLAAGAAAQIPILVMARSA